MPKRPEQIDDDDDGDDDDKPRKFCLQSMLILYHSDGSFNISLSIQDVDVHFCLIRNGFFFATSHIYTTLHPNSCYLQKTQSVENDHSIPFTFIVAVYYFLCNEVLTILAISVRFY